MNRFETSIAETGISEGSSPETPSPDSSPETESAAVVERTETSESASEKPEDGESSTEIAPEHALVKVENQIARKETETANLQKEITSTQKSLNAQRELLGLPPAEGEVLPSVVDQQHHLELLQQELATLREQQKALVETRERERLMREERERVLQEVVSALATEFEEYQQQSPEAFAVLIATGMLPGGTRYESRSYGAMDPEILKAVFLAFHGGRRSLRALQEAVPNFAEYFGILISAEINRRVEARVAEIREQLEQQFDQKPQVEVYAPSDEPGPDNDVIDAEFVEEPPQLSGLKTPRPALPENTGVPASSIFGTSGAAQAAPLETEVRRDAGQ
jgi:hypothetical protein